MTKREVWKYIPGWEGLYQASTWGRIRSVTRTVTTKRHGATTYRGRILKCAGRKYPSVSLTKPGRKRYCEYAHRLVMLTFKGPCPAGKEVCHNNGDSWDCSYGNLRYDTRAANAHDATLQRRGFARVRPYANQFGSGVVAS